MVIKNGLVYTDDYQFEAKEVHIEDGAFAECSGGEVIDAKDCYVIPGLIDIHLHGAAGFDFCDGTQEAITKIAEYELSNGITAICPASMTFPEGKLAAIFKAAKEYKGTTGADVVGINMEGPFISHEKKAAQNGEFIHRPDAEMFYRLQEAAGGLIKLVDIAPEVDGALECIRAISGDVRVSLAHTAASYEEAMAGFEAGARHVTHLHNGMIDFSHREPRVFGAVFDRKDAMAELIGDGVHSTGTTVRMTFQLLGDDRIIIISDSMMATGLPDGQYSLGGQDVTVKNSVATLTELGNIAGSVMNLMNCMRNVVQKMDIPLESAVRCVTINPARAIGIDKDYGSISVGKKANAVILDKKLDIRYIIKDGVVIGG